MDDARIVSLYWERNEQAIKESESKYGGYCHAIAYRILTDQEDADESVNDTWLAAWESMPPHRPSILATYLGKLTRRVSLNRWRDSNRDKRGGGEMSLSLDELAECVPDQQNVERTMELTELTDAVNRFLAGLPTIERDVFVCRYWFVASLREIGEKFEFSESKTKSMLFRTRKKLLAYLEKEGLN